MLFTNKLSGAFIEKKFKVYYEEKKTTFFFLFFLFLNFRLSDRIQKKVDVLFQKGCAEIFCE